LCGYSATADLVCALNTDTLLLLRMLYSFVFVLLIPLSHQNLCWFLLPRNKHNRVKTLTHCAEWSQFVVDYFFSEISCVTVVIYMFTLKTCKLVEKFILLVKLY